MTTALIHCNLQLQTRPHERRRADKGPFVYGRDTLHSRSYWRSVRHTGSHASAQYVAHRAAGRLSPLSQLRMAEAAIRMGMTGAAIERAARMESQA